MSTSISSQIINSEHTWYDDLPTINEQEVELTRLCREKQETWNSTMHRSCERGQNVFKKLIDNASLAFPREESKNKHHKFTRFAELPVEIRAQIWRIAIHAPRIIELEERRLTEAYQYKPTITPPLLRTCFESRNEALLIYGSSHRLLPPDASPEWIRYHHDLVHINSLSFASSKGGYYDTEIDLPYAPFQVRDGRPAVFEHIEALIIDRDLMLENEFEFARDVRHFFPRLRVVIVIVGDSVDVVELWCDRGGGLSDSVGLQSYERCGVDDVGARRSFAQAVVCPPRQVRVNRRYAEYVRGTISASFTDEERKYVGFLAPLVVVRCCDPEHGA